MINASKTKGVMAKGVTDVPGNQKKFLCFMLKLEFEKILKFGIK